jgi:release factor glutamine methyltransferase
MAASNRHVTDYWLSAVQQLTAAGIEPEEARLEAEVLLRHVLGIDRAGFLIRRNEVMPNNAAARFSILLQRRLAREPLAYIIGHREFYGLDFLVDGRVLIPRPETEGLVERVMKAASRRRHAESPVGHVSIIADVGTGCGCIAIALAVHLPDARLIATDASSDALDLARANARRHSVEQRITFVHGDLLDPLPSRVDIIVANPPYVASAELAALPPEISRYEPRAALDGGPDGLNVIRRLLAQAPSYLQPDGMVLLEIADGQGHAVTRLAQDAFPGACVTIEKDLAGLERYLIIT